MSVDLAGARVECGEVTAVDQLGNGVYEITAHLPHLAATVKPGQFAQLRCGPGHAPLLRRPFSVAWSDAGTCTFVFDVVGVGTALLAQLEPGDQLDCLGPLGSGFSLDAVGRRAVCVSGGLGCAPFPILARALRDRGVEDVIVLNGAASAERLYPAERFQHGDGAIRILEATDDGSAGHHGYVTELVAGVLDGAAALFACGPNPMLAALATVLDRQPAGRRPMTVEASLEAAMGCGFGTCLGCALPVRNDGGRAYYPAKSAISRGPRKWALCCTDGPVMAMGAVDWAALLELPGADVA
jgi:dihydroorotate dehydrogenase electron transfer subunit